MAARKKELTERQKALLKQIGEQLYRARDRAGLQQTQLAPLVGWKSASSVSKTENGGDTDVSDLLAWADACDHEVIVAPRGSASVLGARLDRAQEGDRGSTLRRLTDDIAEARERLDRHRALDAS